ncbi:esterase/lipase family protein [Streptomyces sudanensis]|uniref:esterase/lipase family protein n=1 Tax=Streptomyces sudanensis TaxID=436397 RepID=UPI0020CE7B14|nr:alpha/beta fold hydrolase [Streptomyces sudanensis]MCP9957661.1 alpha/beta fold hydrolase [Streptomyces sudanensis]MCQ0001796.1 alpha/beta fold hydrolase [Streptomyces sudanensis]
MREPPPFVTATVLRADALRSAVVEAAVLAGHLLLYPTGLAPAALRPGRCPATAPHGTRPPVVLLHGLSDNCSVFVPLHRALARDGTRHVQAVNHSPLICDLRTAAHRLTDHVDELRARTGHDEVDLVGHSLGGLVARYYVQRLGGASHVRTVVTLGTPHEGTSAAPLAGVHPLVRQMRPDSPVLRELAAPAPGCRTRFISFWSELDLWMSPVETARLDHPDLDTVNVRVGGVGHLTLPVHPSVTARVVAELDREAPASGTTGSENVA